MKIYTRMGDGGETGLLGGRRLRKSDPIFELLGNLDETNASIGLATSHLAGDRTVLVQELHTIQATLLAIGACIASETPSAAAILQSLEKQTDHLEKTIDAWDKELTSLKNFLLPEGVPGAAALHYSRTLVRRTERSFHHYRRSSEVPAIGRYLNRLSDYLFQAARYVNFCSKHPEQIWHP